MEVLHAHELADLRVAALADPVAFASWPLGMTLPVHQKKWLALSQAYKVDPRFRKLLLICPTGSGKTTIANVLLPIYEICNNRSIRIGMVSSDVYNVRPKLAAISRQLTDNPDLIAAFGYVDPSDKNQEPRFQVPKKSSKWSADELLIAGADVRGIDPTLAVFGWKSKMEGRHFDLAICDDVSDWIEAQSPTYREQQRGWYENVMKNRLLPGSREIWIGTRSNAGDLLGYLTETKEYVLIDEPQALVINSETGQEESYWEEMHPYETLKKEQNRDPVSFALKKMNQIVGTGITEFPKSSIEKCKDEKLMYVGNRQNLPLWMKDRDLWFYAGVDLGGIAATKESAYFCIFVVAVDKQTGDRYLVDLVRTKTGVAAQRDKVREVHAKWGPYKILVESAATQAYFYSDTFEGLPIEPVTTGRDKASLDEGIPTLVALAKAGMIHIPWGDASAQVVSYPFVKELEEYPYGENDDTVMAWWFSEKAIRKLFYEAGSVQQNRNFFRRTRSQVVRLAGGRLRRG